MPRHARRSTHTNAPAIKFRGIRWNSRKLRAIADVAVAVVGLLDARLGQFPDAAEQLRRDMTPPDIIDLE